MPKLHDDNIFEDDEYVHDIKVTFDDTKDAGATYSKTPVIALAHLHFPHSTRYLPYWG